MSSERDNAMKVMETLVISQGMVWQPTAVLRWWESKGIRTLQQAWVSQSGAVDWRDVPVMQEWGYSSGVPIGVR